MEHPVCGGAPARYGLKRRRPAFLATQGADGVSKVKYRPGGRYLKYRPPPEYTASVRSELYGLDSARKRVVFLLKPWWTGGPAA